ncbi:hypothetical protein QBC35DRAFT_540743 [Podospora australis]|uniref:Uncharacterized protein n=1 Tax=Podospora australis TaxID=1536484 RepID=A0AAN6X0H7_9PEZI|nr:hypothetical protein QBC35DRAFT_540743 [Podospora australis]
MTSHKRTYTEVSMGDCHQVYGRLREVSSVLSDVDTHLEDPNNEGEISEETSDQVDNAEKVMNELLRLRQLSLSQPSTSQIWQEPSPIRQGSGSGERRGVGSRRGLAPRSSLPSTWRGSSSQQQQSSSQAVQLSSQPQQQPQCILHPRCSRHRTPSSSQNPSSSQLPSSSKHPSFSQSSQFFQHPPQSSPQPSQYLPSYQQQPSSSSQFTQSSLPPSSSLNFPSSQLQLLTPEPRTPTSTFGAPFSQATTSSFNPQLVPIPRVNFFVKMSEMGISFSLPSSVSTALSSFSLNSSLSSPSSLTSLSPLLPPALQRLQYVPKHRWLRFVFWMISGANVYERICLESVLRYKEYCLLPGYYNLFGQGEGFEEVEGLGADIERMDLDEETEAGRGSLLGEGYCWCNDPDNRRRRRVQARARQTRQAGGGGVGDPIEIEDADEEEEEHRVRMPCVRVEKIEGLLVGPLVFTLD